MYSHAASGTSPITISAEQAEAAVYALRVEAHRQDPAAYPDHKPGWPDYDPWPSGMSVTADLIEGVARYGAVPAWLLEEEAEIEATIAYLDRQTAWLKRKPGPGAPQAEHDEWEAECPY